MRYLLYIFYLEAVITLLSAESIPVINPWLEKQTQ